MSMSVNRYAKMLNIFDFDLTEKDQRILMREAKRVDQDILKFSKRLRK